MPQISASFSAASSRCASGSAGCSFFATNLTMSPPSPQAKAVKDLLVEVHIERRSGVVVKGTKRLPLGSAPTAQFDAVVLEHPFEACVAFDSPEIDAIVGNVQCGGIDPVFLHDASSARREHRTNRRSRMPRRCTGVFQV
jgi:hypothetical protein